ncbi:MAG: lytic transglycosylase domain-containing protein [Acidobacteria bacterium]|nr:lytic transglycosylase domain-containing protein [Acidobacteriota bacterium]
MTRRPACSAAVVSLALIACGAAPASAELAFFATGRTLSISGHHLEGGALVLTLRSGGTIICEPSMISSIEPDEVPYPEPPVAQVPRRAPAAAAPASAARYAAAIERVSTAEGVDPDLVRAVIQVESAYRAEARSPKGAMGLMQLMPSIARQYGLDDPFDPVANLAAGIRHLKRLLLRYPPALALAAYNAGEGAVARFGGIPPYPETRAYVSRVLALAGS